MAFPSAIVGIISILSALAPAGVPVAMAHHDGGYGYEGNYGEYGGYYSNSPQWEQPYYAPQTYRTTRRTTRRTSNSAQNGSMQGFRCYYKGKDGACMNYSYQHGPQWNQWDDGIYPSQRYPFAAQSYGYDYPQGYNDQWNDEPYGYDYDRNYRNNRNYNDRWDDDDCYTSRCEW